MNLSLLKSLKFWIAVVLAILGVLVGHGVIIEGSTAAQVVGWIVSLLGGAGMGAVAMKHAASADA